MSARTDHLAKFVKMPPRLTPFQLGRTAWTVSQSLKGLPYGPGWRQDDYIRGFQTAAGVVA